MEHRENMDATRPQLFLRIPPFPSAKCDRFGSAPHKPVDRDDAARCIELMRTQSVGGSFWGARPDIPHGMKRLLVPRDTLQAHEMIVAATLRDDPSTIAILMKGGSPLPLAESASLLRYEPDCDPWHLFRHFEEIWVDADNAFAFIAAIAGKSLTCWGQGKFSDLGGKAVLSDNLMADILLTNECPNSGLLNPFTLMPMSLTETAQLLVFWKGLIDSNRDIDCAAGFAFWKRPTVEPLLWPGFRDVVFTDDLSAVDKNSVAAIWTSRISRKTEKQIARNQPQVIEVEDGFIRSIGLGAHCVPPLSIIADRRGIYFDPARLSDLEHVLQNEDISEEIQAQAEKLRQAIVAASISKYGKAARASEVSATISEQSQGRKIILVPGQVEDDRSVQSGGGNINGNLQLLERASCCEPDAYIIYKPHPDVEAGHRVGAIDDKAALEFADMIVRDGDIIALVEMADHVHVLTSLTGFEALLRGKSVTTHGVPFYAGWGLTEDKGNIPLRRTMRRNLSELVAATLMIYARYLDPVTGLPCPADILIIRLQEGLATPKTALNRFREFQGLIRLTLSKRIPWFGT